MALCAQIVDFVGLNLLNDANQVGGVGKVTVVQNESTAFLVRVLVQMIDSVRIEEGCSTFEAVDFVFLILKEIPPGRRRPAR